MVDPTVNILMRRSLSGTFCFFELYSDYVGVTLLLRNSYIKVCGFSDILFASQTRAANTTRRKPNITAEAYATGE